MSFDSEEFRQALGCYPTGVAVVTARGAAGERLAVTVNSFTSVSLEPPLVAFCLDRGSVWFQAFQAARHFAVNVLREGQAALADDFTWYSGILRRELSKPYWMLVTHFFNHQTHHRGQVHAMLTSAGATPDDTDLPLMPDEWRQDEWRQGT